MVVKWDTLLKRGAQHLKNRGEKQLKGIVGGN